MSPHPLETAGQRLRKVLAVWEGPGDTPALHAAAALARRHGESLQVITCIEPPGDLALVARVAGSKPDALLDRMAEERRTALAVALDGLGDGAPLTPVLVRGKPFIEIIRHVMRDGTDMVVKAAEPLPGVQGVLFASTDQHLIRKCPCPVWLHMAEAPQAPSTVIAAVDVDDWDAPEPETLASLNRRVIETASDLAGGADATVHVVHAWEAMGEGLVWAFASGTDPRTAADRYVNEVELSRRQALDRLVATSRTGTDGPRMVPALVQGAARSAIAQRARDLGADVIVMGTVARTGLTGVIIGNTAEDILTQLSCSVVAVKPKGFVSPIAPA